MLHLDQDTVEPVEIDEHARWVAVRSYCRGLPLAEPRDIYASRRHFIRGTPLVIDTRRHRTRPDVEAAFDKVEVDLEREAEQAYRELREATAA